MGGEDRDDRFLKTRKRGVPSYSAGWRSSKDRDQDRDGSSGNDVSFNSFHFHVVFAGGVGEGRSDIPKVLVSDFDLSDQPEFKLKYGSDLHYRMAVHPKGDGVFCSFPNSCRWYETVEEKRKNGSDGNRHKFTLKESDNVQHQLEDVGQQLSLAFNNEGSALAAGGENGNLKVFEWPSMVIILDEAGAHKSVKDLDFSPDGRYLVSLGKSGPAKVWDLTSKSAIACLLKENDEVFCFCRFYVSKDMNQVVYIAAVTGKGGSIVTWDPKTWKRIGSKTVVRDTISAFNVSADGKLLACGTTQGDVYILNSASKKVQTVVRKAHLGFVTALSFSYDSRALASVSLDSKGRVTPIEENNKIGPIGALMLWATWPISFFLPLLFINGSSRNFSRDIPRSL